MAHAIFILNNGRLSSISRAMWVYKISNSPNQERNGLGADVRCGVHC